MKEWIRTEDLFCEEDRARTLLEYSAELDLLKELIEITEESVARKKCDETFSFEGVCYLFAKSIVKYAKAAYDNMLLGHFDETLMICRALVENSVCLDIFIRYEEKELWKYYLVYSYRKTLKRSKTRRKKYLKDVDKSCKRHHISKRFRQKQEDGSYINCINKNYGWTYKVNRDFDFSGICKLVNSADYNDFQFMSEFSHGTDLHVKVFDDVTMQRITNMISCLYYNLCRLVRMYSSDTVDDVFYDVEGELLERLDEYVGE